MTSILDALAASEPSRSNRRCVIGRFLDSHEGQDGHDVLVATFEQNDRDGEHYRTLAQLGQLTLALDCHTSVKSIQMHRVQECRCYGYSA